MQKFFYSIGEVAEQLSEPTSLVRYWSNYFEKYLKLTRSAKGNRNFHKEDLELMKRIHFMVKTEGFTLDGVMRQLSDERKSVDSKVKALESLRTIRNQLEEIKDSL